MRFPPPPPHPPTPTSRSPASREGGGRRYSAPAPNPNGAVIFQPDRSWFHGDGDLGWTHVVLLGHDWELLMQEMLTFAVADIWFRSTALSIFLTFLLHHAIRITCSHFSEANIANSSMVDQRFLV